MLRPALPSRVFHGRGNPFHNRAADDHSIGDSRNLGSVLWRRNPEADRHRHLGDFPDFLDILTHISQVEQLRSGDPVSDT